MADKMADFSINLIIRFWSANSDYWSLRWDMTKAIKEALDHAGINIPYPNPDTGRYERYRKKASILPETGLSRRWRLINTLCTSPWLVQADDASCRNKGTVSSGAFGFAGSSPDRLWLAWPCAWRPDRSGSHAHSSSPFQPHTLSPAIQPPLSTPHRNPSKHEGFAPASLSP